MGLDVRSALLISFIAASRIKFKYEATVPIMTIDALDALLRLIASFKLLYHNNCFHGCESRLLSSHAPLEPLHTSTRLGLCWATSMRLRSQPYIVAELGGMFRRHLGGSFKIILSPPHRISIANKSYSELQSNGSGDNKK